MLCQNLTYFNVNFGRPSQAAFPNGPQSGPSRADFNLMTEHPFPNHPLDLIMISKPLSQCLDYCKYDIIYVRPDEYPPPRSFRPGQQSRVTPKSCPCLSIPNL